MIVVTEYQQGSVDWAMARCGKPSPSEFARILTPGGAASKQASDYCDRLIAEQLIGRPINLDKLDYMERGLILESEARTAFELETGLNVREVGAVTTDDGKLGCSPDGLIFDTGDAGDIYDISPAGGGQKIGRHVGSYIAGLEIKCPSPGVHVRYLLEKRLPPDYVPQVQGCLYITGLPLWHFWSYHPDMPPLHVEVEPDLDYIDKLAAALDAFDDVMRQRLAALGVGDG